MEHLSTEDRNSEGSFDLFCMFSIVRQCINSQKMVGEEAISQVPSMTTGALKNLKQDGCHNLRQLTMNAHRGNSKGIPTKLLTAIKKIPYFTADNISLSFVNKGVKTQGRVTFNLKIISSVLENKRHGYSESCGFTAALGTYENNLLLVEKSMVMSLSNNNKSSHRAVELKFDWALANANGGNDSGIILLRILSTDRRGLDLQYQIKLSQ